MEVPLLPYYPEQVAMGAYRLSLNFQGVGAYTGEWALTLVRQLEQWAWSTDGASTHINTSTSGRYSTEVFT